MALPEFIGDIEKDIEWSISTLGCLDKVEGYAKEPDCFEAIKDLIRFLKRDKRETCPNRRLILRTGIVANDLIPLLKFHGEDDELFDGVLRLLINLTQPAVHCFAGSMAEKANLDKSTTTLAKQLIACLQESKIHFADRQLMVTLSERLKSFLEKDWENRREEEKLVCQRILVLIENVLHIPPSAEDSQRTETDVTAQDQLVCAFHESGLFDLFLFIGNSPEQSPFHMHLLRIVAFMLEEHKPEDISSAGRQRSGEEKRREDAELAAIAAKEEAKHKAVRKIKTARHTRFAGSYTVQGVPALCPTKESVAHTVVKDPGRLDFLHDRKSRKKIAKNRAPIQSSEKYHRSQLTVRLLLRDFGIQFLDLAYNSLMKSVRRLLNRAEVAEGNNKHGDMYFLWIVKFFTEFACRLENKPLDRVSETLDVEAYHYCHTQLDQYMEMAQTDKSEAVLLGLKARVAIGTFKALLQALQLMSLMPAYQESAEKVKSTIFYVTEYRDITLNLFKKYKQTYLSRLFLTDLIEATGIYMRLLEKYSTESGGFLVQKKRKKQRKRRRRTNNEENKRRRVENSGAPTGPSEEQIEEIWEEMTPDLCSCLQGHEELPQDVVPFDAAMDVNDEIHKKVAMARIQKALRERRPGLAVALYRAARELWTQDDVFGAQDIEPEMEFMELKEVLIAELEQIETTEPVVPREGEAPNSNENEENEENLFGEEEEYNSDDEEDEREEYVIKETPFEFRDYFKRFATENVIKCYISLVENFDKNSLGTNRWITKFLDKVAFQHDMAPLLYQARLFRVLQKIGKNPAYKKMPHVAELREFGRLLIKKFFEHVKHTGPKVFVEILFWKNSKQAYEIQYGYGETEDDKVTASSKIQGWSEELEYEAEGFYEQYQTMEEKPDCVDVIDFIQGSLSKTMSRAQIKKFLKRRGYPEGGGKVKRRKKNSFPDDDEDNA